VESPIRTITSEVTFDRPFRVDGFERLLPSGQYDIETDHERLLGLSFVAYRRTEVRLHIPTSGSRHPGRESILHFDPAAFDKLLNYEGRARDSYRNQGH
jgi:hypothetical protein